MNLSSPEPSVRAKAYASRTAHPDLSPVRSASWLRTATVYPALS